MTLPIDFRGLTTERRFVDSFGPVDDGLRAGSVLDGGILGRVETVEADVDDVCERG